MCSPVFGCGCAKGQFFAWRTRSAPLFFTHPRTSLPPRLFRGAAKRRPGPPRLVPAPLSNSGRLNARHGSQHPITIDKERPAVAPVPARSSASLTRLCHKV